MLCGGSMIARPAGMFLQPQGSSGKPMDCGLCALNNACGEAIYDVGAMSAAASALQSVDAAWSHQTQGGDWTLSALAMAVRGQGSHGWKTFDKRFVGASDPWSLGEGGRLVTGLVHLMPGSHYIASRRADVSGDVQWVVMDGLLADNLRLLDSAGGDALLTEAIQTVCILSGPDEVEDAESAAVTIRAISGLEAIGVHPALARLSVVSSRGLPSGWQASVLTKLGAELGEAEAALAACAMDIIGAALRLHLPRPPLAGASPPLAGEPSDPPAARQLKRLPSRCTVYLAQRRSELGGAYKKATALEEWRGLDGTARDAFQPIAQRCLLPVPVPAETQAPLYAVAASPALPKPTPAEPAMEHAAPASTQALVAVGPGSAVVASGALPEPAAPVATLAALDPVAAALRECEGRATFVHTERVRTESEFRMRWQWLREAAEACRDKRRRPDAQAASARFHQQNNRAYFYCYLDVASLV